MLNHNKLAVGEQYFACLSNEKSQTLTMIEQNFRGDLRPHFIPS